MGMAKLFEPSIHPHITRRKDQSPPKVADSLPRNTPLNRASTWLALRITNAVGTMACAVVFTFLALISLPAAISSGSVIVIVAWVAQTFLQLVLLSVILLGQNIQSVAADRRSEATYNDADAILHTALQIEEHLQAQDAEILKILTSLPAPQ
jgi:hypothetical protein